MRSNKVVLYKSSAGGTIDDENFATFAEDIIAPRQQGGGKRALAFTNLTTSKLRSIYGLIMNIYTKINDPADFDRYKSDLQYLKVRMAYEAGRDQTVKAFLDKSFLRLLIDCVKDYDQFVLYCRYAESLVAYFKFYGGKE